MRWIKNARHNFFFCRITWRWVAKYLKLNVKNQNEVYAWLMCKSVYSIVYNSYDDFCFSYFARSENRTRPIETDHVTMFLSCRILMLTDKCARASITSGILELSRNSFELFCSFSVRWASEHGSMVERVLDTRCSLPNFSAAQIKRETTDSR